MPCRVKIFEVGDSEFTQPGCGIKGGGEACIGSCMSREVEVKVCLDGFNVRWGDGLSLLAF
jgi:hypothetical protein